MKNRLAFSPPFVLFILLLSAPWPWCRASAQPMTIPPTPTPSVSEVQARAIFLQTIKTQKAACQSATNQVYTETWAVRANQKLLKSAAWKAQAAAALDQLDRTCGQYGQGYAVPWKYRLAVSLFRTAGRMYTDATWGYRLVFETERTVELAQAITDIAAAQAMADKAFDNSK